MADATVAVEAANLFGLHTNFNTSTSGTTVVETNVAVNDEVGNVECQQNIADITNYSQSATYCGADFMSDIGTFLTQFGDFQTIGVVTGLTINMSAGNYVTIDITGHQHASNAHASGLTLGYADVSDFLPHEAGEAFISWNGFGVPDFGVTTGSNSSPASATVTFSMNHVDQTDEAGDHLVGKNLTPRCELSMDFVGVPTSNTSTLLEADFDGNTNDMLVPLVDSHDTNDSNSDFDTFAFSAHANTDLATS